MNDWKKLDDAKFALFDANNGSIIMYLTLFYTLDIPTACMRQHPCYLVEPLISPLANELQS